MGKTQITIADPQYKGNPINKASVPITMQLDNNATQFIDLTVTVKRILPWWNWWTDPNIPVGITPFNAPQPGNPPIITPANFDVSEGEKYEIRAKMRYKDKMNNDTTIQDFRTIEVKTK